MKKFLLLLLLIFSNLSNGDVRLFPFEFSEDDAYIIKAGTEHLGFFRNSGQILNSYDYPYIIDSPYDTSTISLFELQFVQSADTMYIVHGDYMPRKLTRTSHTAWTLTECDFERGPFLDENETDETITVTGNMTVDSEVTLTYSSTTLWDANHVGALWQITHTVDSEAINGSFTADGNSSELTVYVGQKYDFSTHGTWSGTITLQRSYDSNSTWKDVLPVHYENDGKIQYTES